jgi:hypothetical protein
MTAVNACLDAPHPNPLPALGAREGPSPQGWEGEGLLPQ